MGWGCEKGGGEEGEGCEGGVGVGEDGGIGWGGLVI